jgi:sialate O-acetylesterase
MVLQRTPKGVCDASVEATTGGSGPVKLSVTKGGRPVRGLKNKTVGRAEGGTLRARITGLPAGGPYMLTLAVGEGKPTDTCTIKDVLVGDVWILGGQSNMQGSADMTNVPRSDPAVRAFFMYDAWGVAEEPIHVLGEAVDVVHGGNGVPMRKQKRPKGMGPGLSFGKTMRALTGVPQGLIACAHGGTSMPQWDPKLRDEGGKSLYGATYRRLMKNGGRIAGALFYQGESDANAQAAPLYTERMNELIAALRRDAGDPKLPWAVVQLASYAADQRNPDIRAWNSVQDQQRRLGLETRNVTTVPAVDLPLDDPIHIGSDAAVRLGVRMAHAMHALRTGKGKPPITLGRIKTRRNPHDRLKMLVDVGFDNVAGKLVAPGRPWGFSITGGSLEACAPHVVRAVLNASTVTLVTDLVYEPGDHQLFYGYGYFPYCNVTDEKDRALPVFGPVPIEVGPDAAVGVHRTSVSDLVVPCDKHIEDVTLADAAARTFGWREYSDFFCSLHPELERLAPRTALVFFRVPFACDEPMQLIVHFGYDGPAKLWLDGVERVCDPRGINPINYDDRDVPLQAAAGQHEIVVALLSNQGRAWGIALALERCDAGRKNGARPRVL